VKFKKIDVKLKYWSNSPKSSNWLYQEGLF